MLHQCCSLHMIQNINMSDCSACAAIRHCRQNVLAYINGYYRSSICDNVCVCVVVIENVHVGAVQEVRHGALCYVMENNGFESESLVSPNGNLGS